MNKKFKKLLSLVLACAMMCSMGVTAFASEGNNRIVSPIGSIDENGMMVVDSKVIEVLEDGTYIVATTLKSPFATFATGGTSTSIKYDFKRNNGTIYHTVSLNGNFTFDNVAKTVQFGNCSYDSNAIENAGATFSNFAEVQTFGISKQTAKYSLSFSWKSYASPTSRKITMYIRSDYTGKLTTSKNQSITES